MKYNQPTVAITGLSVQRGSKQVLHYVNLALEAGALVGLLGPSGCGKTTLMRAVMGIQRRVYGNVQVLGLPAGHKSLRHKVGYMSQDASAFRDLTVGQNLRYFSRVLGVDQAQVDQVLEQVGLTGQTDQLASTLSGGQWNRVSLAIALLGSPELLVLDEPTVGLDPVLRVELWELFRGLASGGTTIIVSSHVMDEAARCDRLVLMRQGRILADEPPAALLERTGAADAEGAFLQLIGSSEVSA